MTKPNSYDTLLQKMGELAHLAAAQAVLSWDQETYMPDGAQEARAQQLATLSALIHQKFTAPEMGELLEDLQGPGTPESEDGRLCVERVAHEYARSTRLPEDLVREMTRAQSEAVSVWSKARPENDFATFLPSLEQLLDLERQKADCLKEQGQTRYDALLEGYERGMTGEKVEQLFSELQAFVTPLVQEISGSGRHNSAGCLEQDYPIQQQWDFGLEVLKAMGFDFRRGRQDKSAHPFTTGFHPTDVRITTRFVENHLAPGLFATVHEGGHALYEQGIAPKDYNTPLGASISLGVHESQSRLWENQIARGRPFWKWFYPKLVKQFPTQLKPVSLEEFYSAINTVRPSLIRVEADEVTYSLHIILRFELEKAMLEGELAPKDLPDAWNAKMQEYLGLKVPNVGLGCMQDIHWAWGLVGYFPTYTLGNLYAAQMMETIRVELPDLDDEVAAGKLTGLTEWLREKVHRVGNRKLATELVESVTGRPPEAGPFMEYLKQKFGALYGIS